ncbi:MAG TPA: 2-dehydropantoate 2-reductase [Candidatus Dormibacteraeota bacterium]|nr:2-dehydropantoate 2-reductase [Candidatus Dormibacteraeota bacterium]
MGVLRFAVLGPGGVGGLLAALLARAGDSVVVLHDTPLHEVRVESARFGDFTAQVETSPRLSEPVDAVLVTVKATQLEPAMRRVPVDALGAALVIPFLNGIDHVELLRGVYPSASVVPATIRIESTKVGAGVIRQTSPFALVEIGSRGEAVASRLTAAGLDVKIVDDEHAMLWSKLAVLAPMALLTTHERANVGGVRERRHDDLEGLVREFAAVARAEGVAIDPEVNLGFIEKTPAAMETSMQRDQAAGRPLEIDALGGALLRRAAKAGVDVPVTKRLVEELRARTSTYA